MRTVGAFEAKTHLPKLLQAVSKGESILITKRGEPIAILTSPRNRDQDAKNAIAKLRKWRKGIKWSDGMTTRKAIETGRH